MRYRFKLEGQEAGLDIVARQPLGILVNEARHVVEPHEAAPGGFDISIDGRRHQGFLYAFGHEVHIRLNGRTLILQRTDHEDEAGDAKAAQNELRAEMPGTVIQLHARVGDSVAEGAAILTIESMKLQMTLSAPRDTQIAELAVAENQTFDRGAMLVRFAAAEPTS